MTKQLKILVLKSLLGMYSASIIKSDDNKNLKSEKWYQNTFRIYKKCKGMKKHLVTPKDSAILKAKLKEIQDLEDVYFNDGYWNAYSLCVMCLEYLVFELDYVDLKGLLIDLEVEKTRTMLETDSLYVDLQKASYRYFAEVLKMIGE